MKKMTSIVLCVLFLSLAVTAMAESSVPGDTNEVSLNLSELNGVQAHTFTLAAGDSLEIISEMAENNITVAVTGPDGGSVFETNSLSADGQTVLAAADGEYTVSVDGEGTAGNAWIRVLRAGDAASPDEQLAQSPLGYAMQYNPDHFTFESYGTYDYFMPAGQEGGLIDTFLIISVQNSSAQALIDDLYAEAEATPENGAYEELPALEVDSYPMRTVRFAGAGTYEDAFYDYYLIELEAEKTLFAQGAYTAGSQDMGNDMQQMMQKIYLTK